MRGLRTAALAAMLTAALPATTFAQGSPSPGANDAKLAEAHAILGVMFPPEKRDQMFQTLLAQVAGQIEQAVPVRQKSLGDAGADAIMSKFKADTMEATGQLIRNHLPQLMEANAQAYTHEFSIDELKQIHAFAETPAGSHYFSRATALVSDPSVVAANSALAKDARTLLEERAAKLKSDMLAYLQAHPAAAEKIAAAAKRGK